MQIIVSTLLALLVMAQGWTVVLAEPSPAPARSEVSREAPAPTPSSTDAPAASPRTVERARILGMSASTAIIVGAALLFVVVLAASFLSRDDGDDRHRGIHPRL